ncbi:MAG: cellulase family glycosylhydrolase [Bacteroidales bacterium]|nr:cellulase family glycosylhydrolase [Bacteroidales bacterium]
MKSVPYIILLFLSAINPVNLSAGGFLKVQGKTIIDSSGQEINLRGLGIGGWLLQEGYMFETSGFANTQHEFRKKIEELIGTDSTNLFYEAFRKNFVTRRDIDSIAAWGFNSIRLAMHYNLLVDAADPDTFLTAGFDIIDSLVAWCRENQLYLILDLHAAPGGQGHDAPISDYDASKPSLWESTDNQDLTVILWKEIARRYAQEPVIGGYDLLNEPNWELGASHQILRAFYGRLTDAIREVDTNHIVFIEGNWFATDFNGLTPPWDDNMVYSFHRYWSDYTTSSIQYLLNIRNNYTVPLWMGESGENSNAWFTGFIKLLNQHGIGWANWPYKKTSSVTGPLTINKPAGYQVLLNYWNGSAAKPTRDFAYNALMELTDSLRLEHCVFHPDVVHAWITFPGNDQCIPFRDHTLPGRIYCSDYDMGTQYTAYADVDYQNISGSAGGGSWNSGGKYRNDGIDIEVCSDDITNGYNVGWTNAGEWMKYTVDVAESNSYIASVRYSDQSATGKIRLEVDQTDVTGSVSIPPTDGWQNWKTQILGSFLLEEGKHTLRVVTETSGFNLNYIDFSIGTGNNDPEIEPEQLFNVTWDSHTNCPVIMAYQTSTIPYKIELFDLSGKKILSDYFTGAYPVEQNLPCGLYFVAVSNATAYSSQKIIIHNL